jgi:hypothetical protein
MTIDLNQLIREQGYKTEITPPEPEHDAALRRFKERWVFVAALIIMIGLIGFILGWLIAGNPSADDKKWIFAVLGSAFGFSATVLLKK